MRARKTMLERRRVNRSGGGRDGRQDERERRAGRAWVIAPWGGCGRPQSVSNEKELKEGWRTGTVRRMVAGRAIPYRVDARQRAAAQIWRSNVATKSACMGERQDRKGTGGRYSST
jgi:hypothetical protein